MDEVYSYVTQGVRKPRLHRRVLFLCGAAGSGKTTFTSTFLKDADMHTSYVYLNIDELVKRFSHLRRDAVPDLLMRAVDDGYSVFVDGTCRNRRTYLPIFEDLLRRKIRITMGIMYVSLETALSRIAGRKDQSIPPDVVRDIYMHTKRNIESYMHLPEVFLYSHDDLVLYKKGSHVECPNPSAPFYFPLSRYCQKV
jgi:predicted ABC-type ATPase